MMFFNDEIVTQFVAFQRRKREQLMLEEPRVQIASLDGYTVGTIGQREAESLIDRYEYLGTMGRAEVFIGLFSPYRELHGVAAFGRGPNGGREGREIGSIRALIGEPALCLERGACVHYAPKNAASYLISRACRLVSRLSGTAIFFAYADPKAGEYGAVYQAANWIYLGQGDFNRKSKRTERMYVLRPGADADDPRNWRPTYDLRRGGRRLGWDEARAAGWRLEYRPSKYVYATNVGRERKAWLARVPAFAYPAPRPELKRRFVGWRSSLA